ncbi:MAG: aminotransferase class V-fold PLP-dependent enzyme [Candidatus Binatia bacterium]
MASDFDVARRDYPALEGTVFLNSASMGMVSASALAALEAELGILAEGPRELGWARYGERLERGIGRARAEAARLVAASAEEIGLVTDTTGGLHGAIDAIPFRDGDNVVLSDLEYPQVALAADNARRENGVEIRFVRHRGGRLTVDDYRCAIDSRTRAVLVSSVGWVTGQLLDLAGLSALADERGFFLVVDAVQHLGGVSIDVSSLRIDFLVAGGYKWLCAPFGCGILFVRRGAHELGLRVRRLGLLGSSAPEEGWDAFYDSPRMVPLPGLEPEQSVRRFEAQGTPNRFGAVGLAAALEHRNQFAADAVDRHIRALGALLIESLAARGATVWTPVDEAERAGIVSFTFGEGPSADKRLHAFLESRKIFTSARWCSGVGGVRLAVHLYNSPADVDALVSALDDFRGR